MATRIVVEFPSEAAAREWFEQAWLARWFPSSTQLVADAEGALVATPRAPHEHQEATWG